MRNRFQVIVVGDANVIGVYHYSKTAIDLANSYKSRVRMLVFDLASKSIIFRNWE